jgi:hypothetical protein
MELLYPREMLTRKLDEKGIELDKDGRELLFEIVDTVFFASLMVEESEPVRVAVVHHEQGARGLAAVVDDSEASDGEKAWDVTELAPRDLTAEGLAKLSRGIEYGAQLVVIGGTQGGKLRIEGTARRMSRTDGGDAIRIAAPRPGVLVFEQGWHERLRFEGGEPQNPNVDVLSTNGPGRIAIGRITGSSTTIGDGYSHVEGALRRLLTRMRSTGAGAILAMLTERPDPEILRRVRFLRADATLFRHRIDEAWHKRVKTFFRGIGDGAYVKADEVHKRNIERAEADAAENALEAAIEDLARFSAIDGAVLAGPNLEVYGAGYLIASKSTPEVFRARDASLQDRELLPALYGARHRAAYSFVADGLGRAAFVVSEDGPVTCAVNVDHQVVALRVRVPET